jgi:O-antigen ligase
MSSSAMGRHLFAVLSLLVFSRALVFQFFQPVTERGDAGLAGGGNVAPVITQPEMFWVYIAIYLFTGALLLPRWRPVFSLLLREWCIALLLLLALLSTLWSVVPAETLTKSVALGACTMFGIYLALEYSLEQQAKLLAWTFSLLIFASLAMVFLFPHLGVMSDHHSGLWQGAFPHKNLLGKFMCLGATVFFILAARGGLNRHYWLGFLASLMLLLLSSSKSALLGFGTLFLSLGAYFYVFRRQKLAVAAMLSGLVAFGSVVLQKEYKFYPSTPVNEVLHRLLCGQQHTEICRALQTPAPDSADMNTVSGRLELWQGSWGKIQQHPWLGYGFGDFWRSDNPHAQEIWTAHAQWKPKSSHNGFFDLWLELGLAGLFLFILSIVRSVSRGLHFLFPGEPFDSLNLFYPALLAGILLLSLTEGDLVEANFSPWILVVMITFSIISCDKNSFESKRRQTGNSK